MDGGQVIEALLERVQAMVDRSMAEYTLIQEQAINTQGDFDAAVELGRQLASSGSDLDPGVKVWLLQLLEIMDQQQKIGEQRAHQLGFLEAAQELLERIDLLESTL